MLGRLLVVALFVGYLVEQSPHLVHHLFEPDEVQSECSYLAAGDRNQLGPVDGPVLAPAVEARPVIHEPGPTGARAPPAIS
jgi:hypothetical protein